MLASTRSMLLGGNSPYLGWDLALDFKNGIYRSGSVTTRDISQLPGYSYLPTALKFETAANGALVSTPAASPGIIPGVGFWSRPTMTNLTRNSVATGVAVGTPGTAPTGWGTNGYNSNGITVQIVATGVDPMTGANWFDYRLSGTNNATGTIYPGIYPDNQSPTYAVAPGDVINFSMYVGLVGGSIAGLSGGVTLGFDEANSTGGYLTGSRTQINYTSTPTRQFYNRTISNANTVKGVPYVGFIVNVGSTVDVTVRVMLPQVIKSTYPLTSVPVIPTPVGQTVTLNGDVVRLSQPIPGDTDFLSMVSINGRVAGGPEERYLEFSDNTANNRLTFVRGGDGGLINTVARGGVATLNQAMGPKANAGKFSMMLRRRGGKFTQSVKDVLGNVGYAPETAAVAYPIAMNTVDVGHSIGIYQPNAPIQFIGWKRGTFNDIDMTNQMIALENI